MLKMRKNDVFIGKITEPAALGSVPALSLSLSLSLSLIILTAVFFQGIVPPGICPSPWLRRQVCL
ncbi:MAG: hypothetical protein LBK40_04815 [Spirochaetaceae bacterium]|jgi:hypothetical protein|nr:hypothetical protein [Spirochaetaceae bacterium]